MASSLVPDFPAVMVALEHLEELVKELKEEGVPFAPEVSLHLTEIAAAATGLEGERRTTHEHLEVETIENSKLRQQINNTRERMSQEFVADIAAARASNAEETEQLQKDLSLVSQLQEATVKRQESLLSQNEVLHPEREQVKAEHENIIAVLNEQITLKYHLQMQLDHTREQIEELKACIAAVELDKITTKQNMVLEKEASIVKKDSLSRDVDQANVKITEQKEVIRRHTSELERVNHKKQQTLHRQGELMSEMSKLESNIRGLTASRCQFEKQLEGETQKYQELHQQREMLKKELCELEESFILTIQHLKAKIATVEGKIEEGRVSGLLCQEHLAQMYEIFKCRHDEENEVRAENFHVLQQLKRSKLQLEERIASIVKHSKEIKEMDKKIRELLEADKINKQVFERNQKELCSSMAAQKKNLSHLEEEKSQLEKLLEEAKRKQEEYVAKMTSDISIAKRRYEELRQEEAQIQILQPESADADLLLSQVSQFEVEYTQIVSKHLQEIAQSTTETESITRRNEEKQREVEEKEEILKETEAILAKEQSRHQGLETFASRLRQRKMELELLIQKVKGKTSALLQPKEEMKAELEVLRAEYIGVLDKQALELRAVEMSIYDSTVKLEQVNMENSRLRLCIRQMAEDVGRARQNKDRYWQEIHKFTEDIKALLESLQETWGEDLSLTQDYQSSDGVVLLSMSALLNHLKSRRQQLGNVSTLLHQQMLDFSKRLGDKTVIDQHS